jgi:hypothetical protein
MLPRVNGTSSAISTLDRADLRDPWMGTLRKLAADESLHGLISGRSHRLLFDAHQLDAAALAIAISRSLSRAAAPAHAAAWLEGFLSGSGLLLIHQPELFALLDQWVIGLSPDHFTAVLPLLRRTFSTFPGPERLQLGELAKQPPGAGALAGRAAAAEEEVDETRANRVLPMLRLLLGTEAEGKGRSERN